MRVTKHLASSIATLVLSLSLPLSSRPAQQISEPAGAIPVAHQVDVVVLGGGSGGVAAAMIARQNCPTRQLDIKTLQRHLVEIGNLPETILAEIDSFPLPQEQVAQAVGRVAQDYDGLEIVLARFDVAQPLLRDAYAHASLEPARLVYAHILGMMGDTTGAATLAHAVASAQWDQGWRYTGMGQFGPSMSHLDSLIIALGRTRSPLALKPLLEKLSQLQADAEFSHFRALTLALEILADAVPGSSPHPGPSPRQRSGKATLWRGEGGGGFGWVRGDILQIPNPQTIRSSGDPCSGQETAPVSP